jgi:hypothetical protein
MSELDPHSETMLRDALGEAQATVRAYDTKAQIVGVGYIFSLGIVSQVSEFLPQTAEINASFVIGSWGLVILPILLFGFVLYPTRKTAPKLDSETGGIQRLLYVEPNGNDGPDAYIKALQHCDMAREYAYELFKVSKLRELKRHRFLRALFSCGIAYAVLFGSHISRSVA